MTAPSDPGTRQRFVDLSAALTGFPAEQLGNAFDPAHLADVYLAWVLTENPSGLAALLAAFDQSQAQSGGSAKKATALVKKNIIEDTTLQPLARRIMRLWYLGRWYEHEPPAGNDAGPYLSAATYVRALAWQAMDTKAIGYSEFTDQYWKRRPGVVKRT